MSEYNEPLMGKKTIEALWEAFGDCNRDDDCIDSSWCGWECGTNVHDIWHWFDEQYARWGGVHALMFPDEHKKSKYGQVMAEVTLQAWINDYAIDLETIKFDCGKALDDWPIEWVTDLVGKTEAGDAIDEIFTEAVFWGLVDDHDGPFDCYICNQEELEAYIEKRRKEWK